MRSPSARARTASVPAVRRLAVSTRRSTRARRKRSAAIPPTSTKTSMPSAPTAVTAERSTAVPSSCRTWCTRATAHIPAPKTLLNIAKASTRYRPSRNGSSARGRGMPPVSPRAGPGARAGAVVEAADP